MLGALAVLAITVTRTPTVPVEVERGNPARLAVALTFDAGGETDGFTELLAALEAAHVRCTFFLTGQWASQHPDLARLIHKRGHEIGNHTWSHPDLTQVSDNRVRNEIDQAEQILTPLNGRSPRPLWRAPYGARNGRVLRIANELGYRSIYWTIDSLDSLPPRKSPDFLVNRIMGRSDRDLAGAIILMHVGEPTTAQAVPEILERLQRRGFSLVTISDLLDRS